MFKKMGLLFLTLLLVVAMAGCGGSTGESKREIVLSYQTWTESIILGEIFKTLIEERTDIPFEIAELESTMIQWEAYKAGEIDIWPSYTSTGYMTILEDTGLRNPDQVYDYVKDEFEKQFGLIWMDRLGFYNNYDLAVTAELAEEYDLETYSDLAEVAGELKIAADVNFLDRADCYPLLQEKYGMDFEEVLNIGVTLKYPAIQNGEADVVNCYTTDAKIQEMGLVVLEDDKNAFPPYDAAPVLRAEVLEEYPELGEIFSELAGKLSNDEMRNLNYQVDVEDKEPAQVARDFLEKKGLI